MKTLFYALLGIMVLFISGCAYTPQQLEAELNSLEASPKYYCSGESLHFTYEGLAVDKVTIKKNDGSLLLEMINQNQSGEGQIPWYGEGDTPPMKKEWLPLMIVFHSNSLDKDYPFPFPPNLIVNIDDEQWTGFYQEPIELTNTLPYTELSGVSQEYDSESGEVININHYDVYQDFNGFRWDIPNEFGARATLVKIKNLGQRTMTFHISGVQGEFTCSPGHDIILSEFKHPAGAIFAYYDPPEKRLIGKQKGEETKPTNEHYSYEDLYRRQVSAINLMVRCSDE